MIFYISSQGHAATKWISDTFSMHPYVVCWHAVRTVPPVTEREARKNSESIGIPLQAHSGYSPKVARNLAKGLNQCAIHSGKVFGAVHTMWGLKCKEPFESLGGVFGGIVRNPLVQMHSIMNAFTPRKLSYDILPVDYDAGLNYVDLLKGDAACLKTMMGLNSRPFKEHGFDQKLRKIKLKLLTFLDARTHRSSMTYNRHHESQNTTFDLKLGARNKEVIYKILTDYFHYSIVRTIVEHELFVKNLPSENIIVMEKMVAEPDYYKHKFKNFTGLDCDDGHWKKSSKLSMEIPIPRKG